MGLNGSGQRKWTAAWIGNGSAMDLNGSAWICDGSEMDPGCSERSGMDPRWSGAVGARFGQGWTMDLHGSGMAEHGSAMAEHGSATAGNGSGRFCIAIPGGVAMSGRSQWSGGLGSANV